MTRAVVASGGQGDALPSGEYVVLVPEQHMLFNGAIIPFPPGEKYGVLYPVLSADGKKFAGQGHDTKSTWEWVGEWIQHPPSNGTYGHIYDLQGNLHIIAPGPNVTSQGYRNMAPDGTFVMGDDTYTPKHGVSQRTEIEKDLVIGQGHADAVQGVVAWDGDLRRIDTGFCWPVRARWQGDRVALTYTRSGEGVVIRQTTKQELRTLPIIGVTVPTPGKPTTPPPTPKPEPKPVSTPNYFHIVQEVGAQHHELIPLNTTVACGTLTEWIAIALHAADPGWGLLSKSPGENQYRGHGVDSVIYKPTNQVIDLMSGAGDRDPNSTVPLNQRFDIRLKWDEVGKRENNNWMAPIQPEGAVTPTPTPIPAPEGTPEPTDPRPGPDEIAVGLASIMLAVGDLREEIAKLRTAVEAVKVEQVGMWGTAAIPLLGTARVDLQPGVRPAK